MIFSIRKSHGLLALALLATAPSMFAKTNTSWRSEQANEEQQELTSAKKRKLIQQLRLKAEDETVLDWMADHKLFVMGLALGIFNYDDVIDFAQTHPVSTLILGYLFMSLTL